MVQHIKKSAPDLIRDLLGPDQWYLCDASETPLAITGLPQAIQAYRLIKYLETRDAYRAK